MVKRNYTGVVQKVDIVLGLLGIRKLGWRLQSELPGRHEQLLTKGTVLKVMLVRMLVTEQM